MDVEEERRKSRRLGVRFGGATGFHLPGHGSRHRISFSCGPPAGWDAERAGKLNYWTSQSKSLGGQVVCDMGLSEETLRPASRTFDPADLPATEQTETDTAHAVGHPLGAFLSAR